MPIFGVRRETRPFRRRRLSRSVVPDIGSSPGLHHFYYFGTDASFEYYAV